MWNAIHILLGALIGRELNSYLLIFVLALLSHFILDRIPHWDGDYGKEGFFKGKGFKIRKNLLTFYVIIFLVGAGITIYEFILTRNFRIIFGALVSISPDLLNYFYKPTRNKYYRKFINFHIKIQREAGFFVGFTLQLLLMIILIILLVG